MYTDGRPIRFKSGPKKELRKLPENYHELLAGGASIMKSSLLLQVRDLLLRG